MADIITKGDMYNSIRGYKYQHCPVLSGLNKTQLGELVNKFDLNVEPTGKRKRPTGRGVGRNWDVSNRKKSTWKSMGDRTREGVRYTGLLDKKKPVQQKRKEVAEVAEGGKKKLKRPKRKLVVDD